MKNTFKHYAILSAITFVLVYAVTGFILWDFHWITQIADFSDQGRIAFFLSICVKLGLDIWLLRVIVEATKPKHKDVAIVDIEDK